MGPLYENVYGPYYRLVGHAQRGVFVPVTTPQPLVTMAHTRRPGPTRRNGWQELLEMVEDYYRQWQAQRRGAPRV